jgi:diguanylate cyclase (GGDEF)-like protein
MKQTPEHPAGADLIEIIEDAGTRSGGPAGALRGWRVLVVDDDDDVHAATLLALRNISISGRPLELLRADSAADARKIIENTRHIAVVLLDVVMETEDAGLRLVRSIREELDCRETRIILRTGQPGYAPELEVIRDYDINDYTTKSELTRTRLVTSLTTAIRSYEQIRTINEAKHKLDQIVGFAAELFKRHDRGEFAAEALRQTARLLDLEVSGAFCARSAAGGTEEAHAVIGAAGRLIGELGKPVAQIADRRLAGMFERCCEARRNIYAEDMVVLYFGSANACTAALLLETRRAPSELEQYLLEVFGANVAVALENVSLLQQLNFFAYFDPLCCLPNRAHFVSLVDRHLAQRARDWTVALLDIDHFSDINAALGHQTGDLLLVAVADRLRGAFAAEVAVARVAGGAFGLLGPDDVLRPQRLLAVFEQPIVVDGQSLIIQPFVGLERLAEAEGSGADVFKNANIALSRAKNERRERWQYFTVDMQTATRQRLSLLHDLRHATEAKRGLSLYYQPQIDVLSGKVIGAEALMRWRNDQGEDVPPQRFIPLAEYSHLIIELGEWALGSACTQLLAWQREGHPHLRMAVNVSVAQFRDPNFIAMARRCIREAGLDPRLIEIEITETLALSETEAMLETLYDLREFGVSIAIDDFGSGFSSLNHLHRLPINRLKIDRTFVSDLYAGGSGASIAEMIIKLGKMLGLAVIAEGVETREQLEMLRGLGCHEVQGFLFSRPVPAPQFSEMLRRPPVV